MKLKRSLKRKTFLKKRSQGKNRKIVALKKKRSFLKQRWFWDFLLFSFLIGEIIYVLFFWQEFQLTEIDIKAEIPEDRNLVWQAVEKAQQEKLALFFPRTSFLFFDTQKIKDYVLTSDLRIETVEIKKHPPRTLEIIIKRRQPVFIFCSEGESPCFLMDKTGLLFQKEKFPKKESLIIVKKLPTDSSKKTYSIGDRPLQEQQIIALFKINKNLKQDLNLNIKSFTVNDKDVIVETTDGWQVFFSLEKEVFLQTLKLNLLLKQEIKEEQKKLQYVDLRFNKVYYKYRE